MRYVHYEPGTRRPDGVRDIFIICADGLKGLPEAAQASFPQAVFQTCIVHMVRSSMHFVPWKDRKAVCASLRSIYTAPNEADALTALDAFEALWGRRSLHDRQVLAKPLDRGLSLPRVPAGDS